MTVERLDAAAVHAALADLPGWSRVGEELRASWRFRSFAAAVAFTAALAELAEAQQHHPEWRVAYRRVDVATTTHDAGGLSRRDVELARAVSELARHADAEPAS
ncbi:MAG: 4a-hydroxytetrahydrobiopterin dehydratase [Planctomycetes bacterium]|nr:4a-hydroxytetrahydrobiopterin dehydratase [Planctomycetota bacterium]